MFIYDALIIYKIVIEMKVPTQEKKLSGKELEEYMRYIISIQDPHDPHDTHDPHDMDTFEAKIEIEAKTEIEA